MNPTMPSQAWVDRLLQATSEDAHINGRTKEDDARDAWTLRFIARLVSVGLSIDFAIELYSSGEHDYAEDPDQAAIEELDAMNGD